MRCSLALVSSAGLLLVCNCSQQNINRILEAHTLQASGTGRNATLAQARLIRNANPDSASLAEKREVCSN